MGCRFCSVEANESIIDTSLREIEEETGISPMDVKLIAEGNAFRIPYTGFDWVVHPLLFISRTLNISLNWENDEASWRKREEMNDLDTVPGLLDALDVLLNNFRQFVI